MKKTLKVKEKITFEVYGTKLHYSVSEDLRGSGYYLSHNADCNNRAIFQKLGIDDDRHDFVKQIVGEDYNSGNCMSTQFPICTTLKALTKVVDVLIKMCEEKSDGKDFDWTAFEETGAVEFKQKVVIRATTRVKVNLK